MGKRLLIAQTGRGNYRLTNYVVVKTGDDNPAVCELDLSTEYTTGYTFEAVLHELQEKKTDIDTLLLIGTMTSCWGSLVKGYMERKDDDQGRDTDEVYWLSRIREEIGEAAELSAKRIKMSGREVMEFYVHNIVSDICVRRKIEKYLTNVLQKRINCHTQVRIVILKKGIAHNEMTENFDILQEGIEEIVNEYENPGDIDVYFDISNGFRSLPIYIYSFTSYLTRIRRENYHLFMYYGMGDAIEAYGCIEDSSGGGDGYKKFAPMVELSEVTDLMVWINAVNEFRNYGSVRELRRIFSEHQEWDIRVKGDKGERLSQVFYMFDYASNAHNLKVLEKEIDNICSINFKETEETRLPRQAQILLDDIASDFRQRFKDGENRFYYSFLTLKLAEWFCDQERYGSASVALMEGMTTYIMERFRAEVSKIIGELNPGKYDDLLQIEMKPQDWLFGTKNQSNYSVRQEVSNLVLKYVLKNESDADKKRKFGNVKHKIRNIYAHIGYSNVEKNGVEQYRKDIRLILNDVLKDMEVEKNDDSVFYKALKIAETGFEFDAK